MSSKIRRSLATTVAFSFVAAGITLFVWALSLTGYELVPGQQVQNWLEQGIMTVAYAAMAGLLIDAARMLADMSAPALQSGHQRARRL